MNEVKELQQGDMIEFIYEYNTSKNETVLTEAQRLRIEKDFVAKNKPATLVLLDTKQVGQSPLWRQTGNFIIS